MICKKTWFIIICVILVNVIFLYTIHQELVYKTATIKVQLKDDLTAEFYSDKKVSDYITSINGEIIDDYKIDTREVGTTRVSFKYKNEQDIVIPYSFELEVKDVKGPLIWMGSVYYIQVGDTSDFKNNIICVDDTDNYPECYIEGEYNPNESGSYYLKFIAKDRYGNESVQPFTLYVYEPVYSDNDSYYEEEKLYFQDAIKKYKNDNNKIGIDISSWQGDVDFDALKNAGVEFVIIRVGSKDSNDDYFLDYEFKRSIEGFNKVGIPVGIYFYSYARNAKEAREDANWVLSQIKGYNVDLPIAFDFEDWQDYNSYHMSLGKLSNNAKVFLDTIKNAGYNGMLYGSKNYLENFWLDIDYPIWLAHYTDYTDYQGDYLFWQFSNIGVVDGIYGDVDLDIMYERG